MRAFKWLLSSALPLTVVLFVSGSAFAQGQTDETARKNSLQKGKSALMFQFLENLNLREFDGANLSYKHHTADNRAYRVGVTIDLRVENGETKDPTSGRRENDIDGQSIDLSALKLFMPLESGRVGLYYGLGAIFGLDRSSQENAPQTSFSYKSRSTVWSAGVDGVLGVEWFPSRELSFVGEYGTAVTYSHGTTKQWSRPGPGDWELQYETTTSQWRLRPNKVRLGVAVYW